MTAVSKMCRGVSRRALISGMAVGSSLAQSAESRKFNVVLILADNLSYGDLGCYGGPIRTPNHRRTRSSRSALHSRLRDHNAFSLPSHVADRPLCRTLRPSVGHLAERPR